MPEGLTPAEIDAFVVGAMARGDDLYHLDEGALSGLDADLVVTQDLCAVCAVDVSVVDDALAHLGCTAEVLTIDPHTLDEVLESIVLLGRATGHLAEAERLVADQRARLDVVRRESAGRPRPRVMFLEWTDPPFAPGHWIPEMIELAGGEPLLATSGEKSRRVGWEQVHAADPDVVIVAPCGFDRAGCASDWPTTWSRAARYRSAYRSTPSTRTPPGPAPAPGCPTASRSSRPSSRRSPSGRPLERVLEQPLRRTTRVRRGTGPPRAARPAVSRRGRCPRPFAATS